MISGIECALEFEGEEEACRIEAFSGSFLAIFVDFLLLDFPDIFFLITCSEMGLTS